MKKFIDNSLTIKKITTYLCSVMKNKVHRYKISNQINTLMNEWLVTLSLGRDYFS